MQPACRNHADDEETVPRQSRSIAFRTLAEASDDGQKPETVRQGHERVGASFLSV